MPTDWKSLENLERLVAAIIASNGGKVDNLAVARYFNETFDAIENRTRVFKKAAQVLVAEAEAAGRMDMNMKKSAAGGKKTTATPKKGTASTPGSVKSGRVTKRAPKTPSKLKRIDSDDEDEEMMDTTDAVKEEEV
ncbi:hypothetical protein E4T44_03387 [Aureobasidium sp. EXF-8845]|nr:hypothetical protein E4T44_03387 [Aureobasidium sp. EXF-8845]KAI4854236.1 hypothetical protein E4T45_04041 [Aureobasidium sp. EXF-8846]